MENYCGQDAAWHYNAVNKKTLFNHSQRHFRNCHISLKMNKKKQEKTVPVFHSAQVVAVVVLKVTVVKRIYKCYICALQVSLAKKPLLIVALIFGQAEVLEHCNDNHKHVENVTFSNIVS